MQHFSIRFNCIMGGNGIPCLGFSGKLNCAVLAKFRRIWKWTSRLLLQTGIKSSCSADSRVLDLCCRKEHGRAAADPLRS
jgi:hypothetical protein